MKSFYKKLANTNLGISLRNSFNIRPIYYKYLKKNYAGSVSDAFLWRTDNGYKTKFKYSDILKLFYKVENSWVEIHFYSKENKLIKTEKIENIQLCNELEINSKYLNNLEDYGSFYIYHFSKSSDKFTNEDIISNRCYLGYSQNNNLYSFVHGNTLAKFTNINSNGSILGDIVQTSLFKNQNYTIQKYFNGLDKNELFFINPTSKVINFSIGKENYELKPNFTTQLNVSSSIISIKSNCMFFRPTVFSYKDKYIDVHHS